MTEAMLFWVIIAVLAALVSLSILVPLYRARGDERRIAAGELAIYRDQLAEVDRDVERGLIGPGEGAAARAEIARRLIKADATNEATARPAAQERGRQAAAIATVVGVPLIAVGLYIYLGSPDLPDAPLAARLAAPPESQDIATLVARVESHLADNPDDGEGWEVLAPVYLRMGRHAEAATAYGNVVRLLGSTAERETAYGEAVVRANGGAVPAEAQRAFERAVALEPGMMAPRYYLALALGQDGRTDEAAAALRNLADDAPKGAPWLALVEGALARLETPAAEPGPTSADVEAAAQLAPEDRAAMIEGMVSQLAARLEAEPDDAQGWARLVRSYIVLARPDDARTALEAARTALAGDTDGLAMVEAEAEAAGLIE